ncbi:hypothetical protein O4H66_17285 [Comamonadaceae bacterium G21597-S1]|nr:hypothetical protein [Comamonadaceae bacterium G21597-S1]
MKYPRHRFLAPEPGDTGGTGAAAPTDAPAPDATPAAPPEPEIVKVDTGHGDENAAKITALLDGIGKPDDESKPASGDAKTGPADKSGAKPDAQPKPTDKSAKDAEAKDDDLTPPEGANEKTMGRWAKLAERAKAVPDLERRATEAEAQLQTVRQMVAESGLAQDEFQGMLAMGRLFKSDNPEDLKTALQQIDGLRADLATRLGIEAPGVDPLSKHPDLAKDVEDMAMSRERALEVAKLRDKAAKADQAAQDTQEQTKFMRTVQEAARMMDTTLAQRAGTPGHAEKLAFIAGQLKDPAKMKQFVTTYEPHQWQAAVLMMYDAYTPPAPAPTPPAAPQPLRPGYVANGTRQIGNKSVTAEESVEHAWAAAGLPG